MSEKRTIEQLEAELAAAKRLKKKSERAGTIREKLDNAMEAWAKKLRPLQERAAQVGDFILKIFPPAGDQFRYQGLLQSFRHLNIKSPWKFKHYQYSGTTQWSPKKFHASTPEELIPDDSQLLWLAGVTFFVYKSGEESTPAESAFERQMTYDGGFLSRFPVPFERRNAYIDARDPEQVKAAFNESISLCYDRMIAGSIGGLRDKLNRAEAEVKRLTEQIEANKKSFETTPRPVFPALEQ